MFLFVLVYFVFWVVDCCFVFWGFFVFGGFFLGGGVNKDEYILEHDF